MTDQDRHLAARLATLLQVPLQNDGWQPREYSSGGLVVWVEDGIPALRCTGPGAPGPVRIGFEGGSMAHRRRAGHNELLGRAVGWKQERAPRVLDATAGLGRDSFVLADLGCPVVLCERSAVLAVLLEEALERLRVSDDPKLRANGERMRLVAGDVTSLSGDTVAACDVIYLDPMFPRDRKALPGKDLQTLQLLHGTQNDEEAAAATLLAWARTQEVRRVVVKRPRRAAVLDGPEPGHSITGKAVRFDVYPLH